MEEYYSRYDFLIKLRFTKTIAIRQCFISRKRFSGNEIGYRVVRVINAICVGRASAAHCQTVRHSRVLPADSL